jgi:virginiamycin B lyase
MMKNRAVLAFFIVTALTACAAPAQPVSQVTGTSPPVVALTATSPLQSLTDETATDPATGGETPEFIPTATTSSEQLLEIQEYPVPAGSHPHDVAPAPDGTVWYTAQATGELGLLDPLTGETRHIPLGPGSAPHGVIVGPDGAPWITDSGLNAIVRVDPETEEVKVYPLPEGQRYANLNTAVFDPEGILWFTGQAGFYGRVDPTSGEVNVYEAPRGAGPYGIATLPDGSVYYASLANNHIARIDLTDRSATPIDPPTPRQGARRVWGDSTGRVWVSEWNSGNVSVYDPANDSWQQWKLPGENPQPYAVYVDLHNMVWLSDFQANSLTRFDPENEQFTVYTLPSANALVRQILGRPGEVWGAESGTDKLVVLRTGP